MRRRAQFEHVAYLPTPREIRRQCKQIRAGWTSAERRRRAGIVTPDAWQPPVLIIGEFSETAFEERELL